MNLILLEADEVRADGEACLTGVRAAHAIGVLKAAPGREIRIGVIDGPPGIGAVTAIEDGVVRLHCAFEAAAAPRPRVDLLLALPRPKVMRRLWAQLAALGVGRIILTNASRVERHYFDTHILSPECYRPLLIEGLQQARDTRLPAVSIHRQFKILIEDELDGLAGDALRVVAHPGATTPLADIVRANPGQRLLMAIGPEGGWNAFELALLEQHRFHAAGIGPRRLRTDTACVALLAIAQSL